MFCRFLKRCKEGATIIQTANITVQFGEKPLFEDISVKFSGANRYGLIGANGCGKSTLMKVISGELEPSSGTVSIPPDLRVAKLSQNQFAYEQYRVIDTVIMGDSELWKIKQERDEIYAKADMTEEEGMKVANLEIAFGELDGYSAESKAGELLLGLDIPLEQHYELMSSVAPGWKLRVLLAQALFASPDILLLDEPTNNLDISAIRWLEDILKQRNNTTMLIISHDRHFLNSVCTHMADLDYGTLQLFPGNYDEYMTAATQAREKLYSENAKKKAQIAELQEFVSRFSANASKAKQATSRAKQIDKIQLDHIKPSSRQSPFIRLIQNKKLFRNALLIENLTQGYDNNLFSKVNLSVEVAARIAIIGQNGVGKTTLLETLMGNLSPKSGAIKWSENANVGYYAQNHSKEFNSTTRLLEWMTQWRKPEDDEQAIRGILGRLLFSRNDINKPVNVLSGGEQGRMLLGKLILQQPNILVMDEPTNHMDMESIEALNLALENYPGTLLFVSHDRQFVSSIATRILEIKENKIINFSGSYDDYLASQDT